MLTESRPADGFAWDLTGPAAALVCQPLAALAPHLYTTRRWRLGAPSVDAALAWHEVAAAIGVSPDRLSRLRQVHGAAAVVIRSTDEPPSGAAGDADILTTIDPGRAIAIQAADCAPILLVDARTRAVAAAHAGWRGLAARVPAAAVQSMVDAWGTRPEDLMAAVGPSIGACCYEVDTTVRVAFEAAGFGRDDLRTWFGAGGRPEHWQFDGWAAARDQLEHAGVRAGRIYVARVCTGCHPDLLCSFRRQGAAAGRLAAVIRPGAAG
jgi:purine-nucleoside/S-methyl-5'-thioadenosine phosphorylase / adenosine deaminase